MKYSYSNQLDVTATVDISLRDLDKLIDILRPIAVDDDHRQRYSAADLSRALEEARTRLIQETRGYMAMRDDAHG